MDGFDQLPDSLIHQIFNSVCDTKTLIRCRSVSKRFNSLVPQTESLLLKVDCVISPESDPDSLLLTLLKSFFKSLHHLLSSKPAQTQAQSQTQNSPAQILSRFSRIRHLSIELPAGDLRLDKNAVVRWRAEFGKSLKSCVIFGFRCVKESNPSSVEEEEEEGEEGEEATEFAGGLKDRVVWTISALIAASARHFLLKEVVREHKEMEKLVLIDKEEEGTLVMDKDGLKECREEEEEEEHVSDGCERNNRTMVPNVRMRMRHQPRVQLKGGGAGCCWVEGATLVVVRPSGGKDDVDDDAELALGAFGSGVYGQAVHALLKTRSYMLEMNSF